MSNTPNEMVKINDQPCEMVSRNISQTFEMTRNDHQSFDMGRYVSQSSDMVRGPYQPFENMAKGPHQPYEMSRTVAPHHFEMTRGVAPTFDMSRNLPQPFEMARGVHQPFDMTRSVGQQFDMSRNINQHFEMSRGNTHTQTYDMSRGPQGYEMQRGVQTYEMPRGTTQPYEMIRQPIEISRSEMDMSHTYDYGKSYQPCPEQLSEIPKDSAPIPDTHQSIEVPLEMPIMAPQSTVKTKGSTQKGASHPFDFAKGYAQQLEMAKKAAENALQAKMQAQKAERERQEAEQAEKAKQEAERAKHEEESEKARTTVPSELLKLYTQQLEMMKNASKSSEIAKMYARQLEMAKSTATDATTTGKYTHTPEKSKKGKSLSHSITNVNGTTQNSKRDNARSTRASHSAEKNMEVKQNSETDTEKKGDPPPFEMAKYLAQLSKMMKGSASSSITSDTQQSEEEKNELNQSEISMKDVDSTSTEGTKTLGLTFPFDLMKNLGLQIGMGIPGVSGPRAKRDRQELTIANKAKLIEQVEARGAKKKADIAREWGLRPSTLSTIMKNKERIMTQFKSQRYAAGRRRMRTAAYPDVEEALLTWFRYARAASIPITGPVLQGMGVTLAQELGHPEFSCSVGWLDRFKARHGLSFNPKNQESGMGTFNEPENRASSPLPSIPPEPEQGTETQQNLWLPPSIPAEKTSEEPVGDSSVNTWVSNSPPNNISDSVTEAHGQEWFSEERQADTGEDSVATSSPEDPNNTWFHNTVPALLRDYKPKDIFSASEAALFYNLLPDRSLTVKGEEGHKWTWLKERITIMIAVNMDGSEKVPLHIIGQIKDPKSLYSAETLPLPYEANESAMMTSSIFEKWLSKLQEQYQSENRNIVLILDSCPAHPNIDNLHNIKLVFLPTDTISKLQPIEQGIIQTLKAFYRRLVLEKLIQASERRQEYEVTILEAMELLKDSWEKMKSDLIIKSFKQAGLDLPENSNNTNSLCGEDEIALLERARQSGLDIPGEVTFEAYLNVDSQVQTTVEQDDVAMDSEHINETETNNAPLNLPGEAMQALATLRKFLQEREGDQFNESLTDMENCIAKHIVKPEVSFVSE